MSEECTHDCSSCGENCPSRQNPQSMLEAPHAMSRIGKVVAVVSGKGGVGKTSVTAMLAVLLQRRGLRVGVLDADITGPSIPQAFGVHSKATGDETAIYPVKTKTGIPIMSINLLLPDETDPVVWRGPIIGGTVKQFWTDVAWGELDVLLIDMPPGTGDVPLTVFQSIPVDGVLIVTSPQELVSMVVQKAVKMTQLMHIPVAGVIENYSYFACPDCGKQVRIFGDSHIDDVAKSFQLPVLAKCPIDPEIARLCDMGLMELVENEYLAAAADAVEAVPPKREA